MSEQLLTARGAARMLKLSLSAFYAFRKRHHVPNAGLGRRLLFRPSDLMAPEQPVRSTVIDFAAIARADARRERRGA